jgi:hypothetical protein
MNPSSGLANVRLAIPGIPLLKRLHKKRNPIRINGGHPQRQIDYPGLRKFQKFNRGMKLE